jgi:hypothetical protein
MRTALLIVLTLGVFWAGGEQHRGNCIDRGRVSCSVLPWDNGNARSHKFDFKSGR